MCAATGCRSQPMDRGIEQEVRAGWLQVRAADAQWSLRATDAGAVLRRGRGGISERAGPVRITDRGRARCRTPRRRSPAISTPGAPTQCWAADAAAGGTPLAVAVPRQLRGFIALLRGRGTCRTPDSAFAEARTQFERAAALAPQSSAARNLVTITQVAQAYRSASRRISRRSDSSRRCEGCSGTDPEQRACSWQPWRALRSGARASAQCAVVVGAVRGGSRSARRSSERV